MDCILYIPLYSLNCNILTKWIAIAFLGQILHSQVQLHFSVKKDVLTLPGIETNIEPSVDFPTGIHPHRISPGANRERCPSINSQHWTRYITTYSYIPKTSVLQELPSKFSFLAQISEENIILRYYHAASEHKANSTKLLRSVPLR